MTTWLNQLEGTALALEARLVHRTARYLVQGNDNWQAAQRDPRPVILAAWHGMTMMLAGYFLQQYDMSRLVLMMPDDWRGDQMDGIDHPDEQEANPDTPTGTPGSTPVHSQSQEAR